MASGLLGVIAVEWVVPAVSNPGGFTLGQDLCCQLVEPIVGHFVLPTETLLKAKGTPPQAFS